MKKVKIMLMAIAVLAVVGGALAFKAKTLNGKFCISDLSQVEATATSEIGGCPNYVETGRINSNQTEFYLATQLGANGNAASCQQVTCPALKFDAEQ